MLVSAMLFWHELTKALLSYSFELNPYDPCVVNKMVNSEQLTICWHDDDLKSSHIDPKVNDEFYNNGLKTCLDDLVKSKQHETHYMLEDIVATRRTNRQTRSVRCMFVCSRDARRG